MNCDKERNNKLIREFYKDLDEELLYFNLPSNILIDTYLLIEYEYVNEDLAGIGGLREGNCLFLIVKKRYQSNGIGQKIINKIIQKAKNNNINYIRLSVVKDNKKAVHIYEKYGFKKIFTIKVSGMDSYYMVRSLPIMSYFTIKIKIIKHYTILLFKSIKNII